MYDAKDPYYQLIDSYYEAIKDKYRVDHDIEFGKLYQTADNECQFQIFEHGIPRTITIPLVIEYSSGPGGPSLCVRTNDIRCLPMSERLSDAIIDEVHSRISRGSTWYEI